MTVSSNRRSFLGAIAAASALNSAALRPAIAQEPKRRYGLHTPKGQEMLAIYADAVRAMSDTSKYPEGDARSWTFQWYTHAVRRDKTKDDEIARVYTENAAASELAKKMWDTCEAHNDGRRIDFFLPWHRMYLHYFEEIVRGVSGRQDFTLPYWDYTNEQRRALPVEFRKKGDAKWGSLYRPDRYEHANGGKPIDHPQGRRAEVSLRAMRSVTYDDNGADAGFGGNLDGGLHGAVHVNIGTEKGMGDVPWAAADPVFWVHHCNIDRVWSSWVAAGGKNLATTQFLSEGFTFADGAGKRVDVTVGDALKSMEPVYDELLARPAGSPPFPAEGPLPVAGERRYESTKPLTTRGAARLAVRLRPPTSGPGGAPLPAAGQDIARLPSAARLHVRLEGITTSEAAAGAFDVHVRTAGNARLTRQSASYLGSVGLFGVEASHAGHGAGGTGRTVSFLVSDAARKLLDRHQSTPELVLMPVGRLGEARATVGRVALVVR